ncbi:MAG: hypothetical protein R2684_06465 [Pyrinomonadaceae bacterium]
MIPQMRTSAIIALLLSSFLFVSCDSLSKSAPEKGSNPRNASKAMPKTPAEAKAAKLESKLESFFEKMGTPKEGEWLATFKEDGQTFAEYIKSAPTIPTEERRKVYVLPAGEFDREGRRLISQTAEFIGAFYGLETVIMDRVSIP